MLKFCMNIKKFKNNYNLPAECLWFTVKYGRQEVSIDKHEHKLVLLGEIRGENDFPNS